MGLGVVEQLVCEERAGVPHPVEVVGEAEPDSCAPDHPYHLLRVLGRCSRVQELEEVGLAVHVIRWQVRRQLERVVLQRDVAAELNLGRLEATLGDPAPRARDVEPGVNLDWAGLRRPYFAGPEPTEAVASHVTPAVARRRIEGPQDRAMR